MLDELQKDTSVKDDVLDGKGEGAMVAKTGNDIGLAG